MRKQNKKLQLGREAVRTLAVEHIPLVRAGDEGPVANIVMYNYDGKPVSRYH